MQRPQSIRTTLLWGTFLTLIAVLGCAGWLGFKGGREEAEELFDARLATSARVLESLIARHLETVNGGEPIVIELPQPLEDQSGHPDHESPLGHYYETRIAFQVWRPAAGDAPPRLLARSASAPGVPFAALAPGFFDSEVGARTWRVFVLSSHSAWIEVAELDEARRELAEKLAFAATAPLLIGAPLLLALLSLLVRYGLSPLSELASRLEARKPDALEPLALKREPREIAPVVRALNGLLGRMREALEHERRFIDAAAHELRTPLAALKIHAQNAVAAEDEQARRSSLSRMLDGLDRTTRLASQMLAYSRITGPAPQLAGRQFSLRKVVAEEVEQMRDRLARKQQPIGFVANPADEPFMLTGDAQQLAGLVRNLLDNACQYSPAGTRVEVTLARDAQQSIRLAVTDGGPGIAPELRNRVFESYYRIPGSPGGGSGLGLAIVREIAARHGGRVEIGDGAGAADQIGTRVSVTFDQIG